MIGASKALYFINPELFVFHGMAKLWITTIRKHSINIIGGKECYIEFMKTCNDIASAILNKIKIDDLCKSHSAYISRREIRTLPKMIDECNYCWITKGEKW